MQKEHTEAHEEQQNTRSYPCNIEKAWQIKIYTLKKMMDGNDLRIIKHATNHTHHCELCIMTLSLSWRENERRKYGKANGNYQNPRAMRHLTN